MNDISNLNSTSQSERQLQQYIHRAPANHRLHQLTSKQWHATTAAHSPPFAYSPIARTNTNVNLWHLFPRIKLNNATTNEESPTSLLFLLKQLFVPLYRKQVFIHVAVIKIPRRRLLQQWLKCWSVSWRLTMQPLHPEEFYQFVTAHKNLGIVCSRYLVLFWYSSVRNTNTDKEINKYRIGEGWLFLQNLHLYDWSR